VSAQSQNETEQFPENGIAPHRKTALHFQEDHKEPIRIPTTARTWLWYQQPLCSSSGQQKRDTRIIYCYLLLTLHGLTNTG